MVNMWVYEEMIDGKKLTEIINNEHENVKYLPGHKLPKNVVSATVTEASSVDYAPIRLFNFFKRNNAVWHGSNTIANFLPLSLVGLLHSQCSNS